MKSAADTTVNASAMSRIMADSTNPHSLDTVQHVDMIAGYVNGAWPTAKQVTRKDVPVVTISVNSHTYANVYDVESGDLSPANVPNALRINPAATIYTSPRTWELVQIECHNAGMPIPPWWAVVVGYEGLYPGSVATQYMQRDGCDISIVADFWPGVDIHGEETEMKVIRDVSTNRCYILFADRTLHYILASSDLTAAIVQLGPMRDYTHDFVVNLIHPKWEPKGWK